MAGKVEKLMLGVLYFWMMGFTMIPEPASQVAMISILSAVQNFFTYFTASGTL